MAYQVMWYKTSIPQKMIDIFLEEVKELENNLSESLVNNSSSPLKNIRNSKTSWISSNHWISGLCYSYILKANEENFNYNINSFGERELQYTSYSKGEFYNWHVDASHSSKNLLRKLSFSLQLSDPTDYSGGELQFISDDDTLFFAPKEKGSIIIFDSRVKHRVRKIKEGNRKSLVGWVEGPSWK